MVCGPRQVPGGSGSLGCRRLVWHGGKGIDSRFNPISKYFCFILLFLHSDSTLITLGADAEHMPWRPNPTLFALILGGGRGLASTSGSAVMTVIPAPSSTEVTVLDGGGGGL
jgi:hypothetical protein